MITGPKYKIARRLGAPIFEKTQTHKFKASEERRANSKKKGRGRSTTNFAIQLNEKQKARFTYGVSETQFKNYVKKIIESKITKPHEKLFEMLERRLDNMVTAIGLGTTRSFGRQIVNHGHILVNGRRVDVPSYSVTLGDVISIREGSKGRTLFSNLEETMKTKEFPSWIAYNADKKEWKVSGMPKVSGQVLLFDLEAVIQHYKR